MNIKLSEKLLTILLVLISVGTLAIRPAQEISLSPLGGSIVDNLLNITSYAILFYFIILYCKGFLYVVTKGKLQFLLLAIILFSLFWSEDLGTSLTYMRGLIRIYLLAIYLAMRYSLREQMRLIAWGLGTAASLSMLFSAVMPGYIHKAPELAGMWSGIFGHKNELGYMMAWSAGVFLHLGLSINRYRWLMWVLCGISICLIILSRSTTSLTILLTMILLLPFYKVIKQNNYKQNFYINEHLYQILDQPKLYDAIYTAQLNESKRLWLAKNVERLMVASYGGDLHTFCPELKHADFNKNFLPRTELANKYNQSYVGLILSAVEGANLASSEYLLCGIPVISTPSKGGRDEFFTPENSIIVQNLRQLLKRYKL